MSHDHDHSHEHSHYHLHTNQRSTQIVVLLSVVTMLLELYFGYASQSVALMMEGWHMLSHVLVLFLAWLAYAYLKRRHRENNQKLQRRVLSLSAFASSIVLLLVTIVMIYESIEKFFNADIDVTNGALIVAVIGLIVNGISAYFLHREEGHHDLNMRAAYLHVVSDVIISIFAIVSLYAAKWYGWKIIDPICGLISAIIILKWAIELIRKSWVEIVG
ncbi:MAG: zinc transporter ZitB [Bacteroidetes bacterium]|nr:zinc transporter ZitB [Bacteroidota bacterium]